MNASYKVDENVLLATARIRAVLELPPHIVGPKEVWSCWMRDNLLNEVGVLPKPTLSSPQPRLLGSLRAVLLRHIATGMMDTLCFDEVRADDPSVTGPEYVEILADVLPELKGAGFWWQQLPPSVSLRVTPPSVSSMGPLEAERGSSNRPDQGTFPPRRANMKVRVIPPSAPARDAAGSKNATGPKPKAADHPSNAEHARTSGTVQDRKGKKRPPGRQGEGRRPKKSKILKSQEVVNTDTEEEAGPSKGSSVQGNPRAVSAVAPGVSEAPEASKVCNACKTRGSECLWTPGQEKRACKACVSAKSRCKTEGQPHIRAPRGKLAGSQKSGVKDDADGLKQLISDLHVRVKDLEKMQDTDQDEREELVSRISNLEVQVTNLKSKA